MLKIILLGAIQGLTEFLPVSSSGHLVVAQHFLGIDKNVVFLDVLLHIGTLLALLTFFFKEILAALKNARMVGLIALVTAVTGVLGLAFKKPLESLFYSMRLTAVCFILNGLILIVTRFFSEREKRLDALDAGLMGAAQALAIVPSLSRSGLTIATLMGLGIKREEAFRFSFIASIPAIIGAFLLETKDLPQTLPFDFKELAAGVGTAYVFGLAALWLLIKIILKKRFHVFGYYCLILGTALLFLIKQ